MHTIEIKNLDKLAFLTEELQIIAYMQLLVNDDKESNRFPDFRKTVNKANNYLLEQNLQATESLYELICDENFTKRISVISTKIKETV